ncbi:MAG: hypothetical protein ACLGG9_05395 [Thermoleophilia bacterium]
MRPEDALARVLAVTGVALPRGVLGDETRLLADALAGRGGGEVGELAGRAAAVHWAVLQGPMEAAVARGARDAVGRDVEAFEVVLGWARDPDPDNPFARALVVRAAGELEAARARAREHLRSAEGSLSEDDVRAAALAATVAGAMAVALLDLDPDDFAPEIADYLGGARAEEDVEALARATGDTEIRTWARGAVVEIEEPAAPRAVAAVRQVAAGAAPPDPAHDLVWVPAILALVEEAVERALVDEAAAGPASPGGV